MDKDEVISHLQILWTWNELGITHARDEAEKKERARTVEWIEDTLKLIEEQEPKPVIKDMYGNAYCPHCSTVSTVEMGLCKLHIGTHFCPYCGQAVKFNDNDRY